MNCHENRTLQRTNCIPSADENVSCYTRRIFPSSPPFSARARGIAHAEKYGWPARLGEQLEMPHQICYSEKYFDDVYEYR